MNSEISEMFELITEHDALDCSLKPCSFRRAAVNRIKEISATLNPQIPEPYASMSREEILGGIGRYDTRTILGKNRQLL